MTDILFIVSNALLLVTLALDYKKLSKVTKVLFFVSLATFIVLISIKLWRLL